MIQYIEMICFSGNVAAVKDLKLEESSRLLYSYMIARLITNRKKRLWESTKFTHNYIYRADRLQRTSADV